MTTDCRRQKWYSICMQKKKVFVANWKMHLNTAEMQRYLAVLGEQKEQLAQQQVIIAPSFPYISLISAQKNDVGIEIAAQNISEWEEGAYTGDVSAAQVADSGANYVILGHSERRQYAGETNSQVANKLILAKKYGLTPIVCVGETLEQRENGTYIQDIQTMMSEIFYDFLPEERSEIMLAYEPVWAIGTGKKPEISQITEIHTLLKSLVAPTTPLLYGGSVDAALVAALSNEPMVNGFLVGKASLDPHSFISLISAA